MVNFGTSTTVLLQLSCLPYVQMWKRRKHDAPFLDPPHDYDRDLTTASLARKLSRDLHQTRGDAAATVQVMLGYYKHLSLKSMRVRGSKKLAKDAAKKDRDLIESRIKSELDSDRIVKFEDMVNTTYEQAFIFKFTNFSWPRSGVVSKSIG